MVLNRPAYLHNGMFCSPIPYRNSNMVEKSTNDGKNRLVGVRPQQRPMGGSTLTLTPRIAQTGFPRHGPSGAGEGSIHGFSRPIS